MPTPVTASMLYDLVHCPHRVTMDLFGDPNDRDEINPFIQLLWEKGALHEQNTIGEVGEPFIDLSKYAGDEKERLTTEAMARGESLIYGGRIQIDDLLGDPDLLRKRGDGYVAGDIKSGVGLEGNEDLSKPKNHYAVQIALYTDILERKGISGGRIPFIWDVHGAEVVYDLDEPQGVKNPTTLWSTYQDALSTARQLVAKSEESLPAYSSTCKLCHWYSACQARLEETDDLTLIPDLGRSKRDVMVVEIATASDLTEANVSKFITGNKTEFRGIGPDSLHKFHQRAKLVKFDGEPYLTAPVSLSTGRLCPPTYTASLRATRGKTTPHLPGRRGGSR